MANRFDDVLVNLGSSTDVPARPGFTSSAALAALRSAGTRHVFADSADLDEIRTVADAGDGRLFEEIDGSTANQPLVRKVIERYLTKIDVAAWAKQLRAADATLDKVGLTQAIYGALCARTANDVANAFAGSRPWQVSVQLHMGLGADPEAAKRVGRCVRRMVPSGVVKVPFSPHHPHCFLVARDLEREGIPVNFTSTFSARQVVAAALLADVTLTNVFMGRINQGLEATLLGEHVDLCAQRALRRARQESAVKTLLIVASVRDWQTFADTAGCDVFTSPCTAIQEFMTQKEIPTAEIRSQLETSYAERMTIGARALDSLGIEGISRLYNVEPAFIQFLTELRGRPDYLKLSDGDALAKLFEKAGFGDFFYAPTAGEWQELRKNKLPQLGTPLAERLPLDTLYTLLADADFEKYQEEMDALIAARL